MTATNVSLVLIFVYRRKTVAPEKGVIVVPKTTMRPGMKMAEEPVSTPRKVSNIFNATNDSQHKASAVEQRNKDEFIINASNTTVDTGNTNTNIHDDKNKSRIRHR